MEKAFKDPEFLKLFEQYAADISSPEVYQRSRAPKCFPSCRPYWSKMRI